MLRARDIDDICADLAIERVSVTPKEGWDHSTEFHVSFGPPAYRQLMVIDPKMSLEVVKAKLEAAKASPLVEATSPAQEAKPSPAATPAPAKGKRKRKDEVDGH